MIPHKTILQKDIPEYNHIAEHKIEKLENASFLNSINYIFTVKNKYPLLKPLGLWYGLKWYWIENLNIGMEYNKIDYNRNDNKVYEIKSEEYLYKIELVDNVYINLNNMDRNSRAFDKILKLEEYEDFKKFYEIYKYESKNPESDYTGWDQINWKKVYMQYGGIELSTIHLDKVFASTKWWWGWGVPSGCVWNRDLIKNYKLIL